MRCFAALLLAACAAAPTQPSVMPTTQPSVMPTTLAAAVSSDVPAIDGLARLVHGTTACRPAHGVNPYVALPPNIPRVGELFELHFVTRHGGNAPASLCWMMQSFRSMPTPLDFSAFGTPGCWLLVNPDAIVSVPTDAGTTVRRIGGDVYYTWTPPIGSAGTHFWLQMLVLAPGENMAGFLSSPAVEVIVGS